MARVCVDVPLPHLDRPFDYLVEARQDELAVPGARVRVRFAGRRVDGWLLSRELSSEHQGQLSTLAAVVSPEPVLDPEVLTLARAVAQRWAGTLSDVLRLAVPPRHARVEREPQRLSAPVPEPPVAGALLESPRGPGLVAALARGDAPRAVWSALPGADWPAQIATLVHATLAAGRGALVVVPDQRDLDRIDSALTSTLGAGSHVALSAGLGPPERYRRWLAIRRGAVRAVVGTRAAVWAPVRELGLIVVWDDGDDLHAEPRAPYPHARDVALLRAHLRHCGVILGGHAVSPEAAHLVDRGWAVAVSAEREVIRSRAPRVRATEGDEILGGPGRLPRLGFEVLRDALSIGPVLVQVPRRGYQPGLRCETCRAPARCTHCSGVLGRPGREQSVCCRVCGRAAPGWVCPSCSGTRLAAVGVGEQRTAEDLGRAFPGIVVLTSGGDQVRAGVPDTSALVVATPGAEPLAPAGYAAALLLDAGVLLGRPSVRAGEEAARRWFEAASLVRVGGQVVLAGPSEVPAVQALVRWDPWWLARREISERSAAGLPPATRIATIDGVVGSLPAVAAELVHAVPVSEVLGPVAGPGPDPDHSPLERLVVRVPSEHGAELAGALAAIVRARSARKQSAVRVALDPAEVGF